MNVFFITNSNIYFFDSLNFVTHILKETSSVGQLSGIAQKATLFDCITFWLYIAKTKNGAVFIVLLFILLSMSEISHRV